MRNQLKVVYYPDMLADETTLKKAILFFDELHFMDRPSFTFAGGIGSIGMASPLRGWEALFRRDGVPLFVHSTPNGPIAGNFMDQIAADLKDTSFLETYQQGLASSESFRNAQVATGKYVDILTGTTNSNTEVVHAFTSADLSIVFRTHDDAMGLIADSAIKPFAISDPLSCTKTLLFNAAICSAKMTFALDLAAKDGLVPLADARPFGNLLHRKYARALSKVCPGLPANNIPDLSFAIFDALIPSEQIRRLSISEVIQYRNSSSSAREAFLEHLSALQMGSATIGPDDDYAESIGRLIQLEIMPAAETYKNALSGINERLVGSLAKGVMGSAAGCIAGVQVFGDLSWPKLLTLAGLASAYVGQSAIDAFVAQRAVKRECALSYVLSLDDA
jgi:hypothetical protein